jgi:hypothetical protein
VSMSLVSTNLRRCIHRFMISRVSLTADAA